ncbi:RNA-binding domain-containing protein [Algivirga pacifica]|uniref:ATP-binding protein n=1 Tax=Algivirga pacifica TaxID=1162670 RepID=A0ABP9D8T5_9BACT
MEYTDLLKIISKGESQEVEFKQTLPNIYKTAKTMVSFANTDGGMILVGVRDNKSISGIDPEEEEYLINEAATLYCDPPVDIQFERIETEEEEMVLIVHVPESDQKPHYALDKNEEWNAYIRSGDQCLIASKMNIKMAEQGIEGNKKKQLSSQEEALLHYLHKHQKITLKDFARLVNFSERRARRTLIDLTKEGILRLHDFEKEVFYTLA